MLNREFDQLSMKKWYALWKIMKKQCGGQTLTPEEHQLYEKHRKCLASEES